MNPGTRNDLFINSTPVNFRDNGPNRRASHTGIGGRRQERVRGEYTALDRSEDHAETPTQQDFRTVKGVLGVLKEGGMDVAGFLDALCWGNQLAIKDPATRIARTGLLHSDRLATVVSRWLHPPRTTKGGSRAEGAKHTLQSLVIETMKEIINKEMNVVVGELMEKSADVTEQSVLGTVIEDVQEKVRVAAPVLYDLIRTAAWSKEQDERNTLKDPTKVSELCELKPRRIIQTDLQCASFIICQAAFSRNHRANKMHRPISLYLKACGTAVKAFDTLSALGVTMTQKWALAAVEKVARSKMDELSNRVKTTNFHTTHDNVNRMFRVSHQRAGHNSHLDSGTAATVFIPPNETDFQLPKTNEEFLKNAAEGAKTPITAHEIQELHADAAPRIFAQNVHTVLKMLVNAPGFKFDTYEHRSSEVFNRPPVSDALPTGSTHALDQYLMHTAKIDEASHEGNQQWMDEWARQLGLDTDEEKEKTGQNRIVVWSGDQLTASRLRGLKTFRSMDSIPYEQLSWMEPIFGWFHLQMAFATSLHKQYYGKKAGIGFARAFEMLGKKGLASAKVKGNWFHDFEETLKEIATAHFLCIWLEITGASSVEDLRSRSPEELREFAKCIVLQFASTAALEESSRQPSPKIDELQGQVIQFNRDLLEYLELDDAIKHGHISRMEDLLPSLLYRFQGGGNKLYVIEVTELLQKLHKEWTVDVK